MRAMSGDQVIHRLAKRIPIVEDKVLVATHLEDLLAEMGHQVVGPATRIRQASALIVMYKVFLCISSPTPGTAG